MECRCTGAVVSNGVGWADRLRSRAGSEFVWLEHDKCFRIHAPLEDGKLESEVRLGSLKIIEIV